MVGPLGEALEMEGIPADSVAGGDGVALDDLHVADRAEVVLIILIILLNYHILP